MPKSHTDNRQYPPIGLNTFKASLLTLGMEYQVSLGLLQHSMDLLFSTSG